jgi:3-oxoacyl-[acyl-carrier-protein] synthase II
VLFPSRKTTGSSSRVVITGAGIVTPLGLDWAANESGFRLGKTAFREVTLFDVSKQRVKKAAEVDLPEEMGPGLLSLRRFRRLDRAGRLLLLAAGEALDQCGWKSGARFPVILGTTSGGMALGETFFRRAINHPFQHQHQAGRVLHYQCQQQGLDLMAAFGMSGAVTIIANACASGANAIGHAWQLVRSGKTDRALTGGYDALSQLVFSGFDSLQALSPTTCRPFDAERDGLLLGEGAAVLALESLERAKGRNACILGEISGYGASSDVHHLTQPHPSGEAALASMRQAASRAGLTPGQIGYVNAHGTGTPLNDSAEAAALGAWAGSSLPALPVSSTKAGIGHLLGAAGAVEAAVCLMALRGQWLPPACGFRSPDPTVNFPVVNKPCSASFEHALTNSFGFGGANATLILRRFS